MISRNATNTAPEKRISREPEISIPGDQSSRRFNVKGNTAKEDLIGALTNAYENERARQVTEWESIGRLTFRQTA